jgi:valyl-tRNA synthetase
VREAFGAFRFDLAAQAVYEFTWYEFCDWYLEFSKPVLQTGEGHEAERRGARRTLLETLEALLRLLHPLMPFITEEIWQRIAPRVGKTGRSIMVESFPLADPREFDAAVEAEAKWTMAAILGIRGIRGEFDIAPSHQAVVFIENASAEDRRRFEAGESAIRKLAGIREVRWLAPGEPAPQSATATVGDMKIHLPMSGLIDVDAELARLGKRRSKLEQELARASAKLGNENFVRNAPADVVTQERERLEGFKRELAQVSEQHERVASLR